MATASFVASPKVITDEKSSLTWGRVGQPTRPVNGLILNPHREGFSRFRIDALAGFPVCSPRPENQPATKARQFTALGHKCPFSMNSILDRGGNLVEQCSTLAGSAPLPDVSSLRLEKPRAVQPARGSRDHLALRESSLQSYALSGLLSSPRPSAIGAVRLEALLFILFPFIVICCRAVGTSTAKNYPLCGGGALASSTMS